MSYTDHPTSQAVVNSAATICFIWLHSKSQSSLEKKISPSFLSPTPSPIFLSLFSSPRYKTHSGKLGLSSCQKPRKSSQNCTTADEKFGFAFWSARRFHLFVRSTLPPYRSLCALSPNHLRSPHFSLGITPLSPAMDPAFPAAANQHGTAQNILA